MEEADELIRRCSEDPEAFRALLELFRLRLYSFLNHLAGADAADDLFQEVWLRVLRAASGYEPRGKAASWLFKIANNACLDHLSRRGLPVDPDGDERLAELPSPEPGPVRALERQELRERLQAAIAGLPLGQRQVFLMREYGGLAFKEIAASLDIPLGTALSRMNAALARLRRSLEDIHA